MTITITEKGSASLVSTDFEVPWLVLGARRPVHQLRGWPPSLVAFNLSLKPRRKIEVTEGSSGEFPPTSGQPLKSYVAQLMGTMKH